MGAIVGGNNAELAAAPVNTLQISFRLLSILSEHFVCVLGSGYKDHLVDFIVC